MSCSLLRNYALNKDFDGSQIYSVDRQTWEQGEPRYRFNVLEKLGNSLLDPLAWSFRKLDEADAANDPLNRTALKVQAFAVIGLALLIGALGALFKLVGEWINPHSSLRSKALENRSQALACTETFYSPQNDFGAGTGLLPGVRAYATARFAEAQAGNEAVAEGFGMALDDLWISPIDEGPNFTDDQAYAFCQLLVDFSRKVEARADFAQDEQRLRAIANISEEHLLDLSRYIDRFKVEKAYSNDLRQFGIAYNQIVEQIH